MKNVLIKRLARLVCLTMILANTILITQTAFAEAGAGTATINIGTGGTDASNTTFAGPAATGSVVVGTQSYVKLDLTIGALGIAAAQNNVKVQINTNLFPINNWDVGPEATLAGVNTPGEWFVSYTDTDPATTNNALINLLAASAATNTGLITIQANQQMDATDIIHIYGAVIDINYALAPANVVIQTDDAGANNLTTIGAPPTIATVASNANATVTLGNPTVGSTQNTTVGFTLPRPLMIGDTVEFTLPSSLYVAGLDTTNATQNFGGLGNFDCTATQLVVCTADGDVNLGTGTITLEGITPRHILGAQTLTDFQVEAGGVAAADIATDTSVAVDAVTTAQLSPTTNATITLASLIAGATQSTTVGFTLPVALISGDTVEFTLPAYIYAGGLTESNSVQNFGGAGNFDCVDTAQAILCTADGAVSAGTGTIILLGVTGEYVAAAGALTDFQVEYQGGSTQDIAVDTSVAVSAVTIGAISSASVTVADMTAAQYNIHTIAFTTPYIPNLGKIKITYPSGWNIAGANSAVATALSGLDGTWTATISGQVMTLTQTGGTATAAGAKSLQIQGGIQTPSSPGTGGNATILTEIADGSDIATVGSISTGTVVAGTVGGAWDPGTTTDEDGTTTTTTTTTTTDEEVTTTTDEAATTEETSEEALEPVTVTTESGEELTLSDVAGHWAETEIKAMTTVEIIKGEENGEFNPNNYLNRAEAAGMLYRVLCLGEPTAPLASQFTDVAVTDWFAGYVVGLKDLGLANGKTATTYAPSENMNRAEFLSMAMNVYYHVTETELTATEATTVFTDVSADAWYALTITEAYEKGFVGGKTATTFAPAELITRAEAARILYTMFYDILTEVVAE